MAGPNATKRLIKELKTLQSEGVQPDVTLRPVTEDDLFVWEAAIRGPPETPYENAFFKLEITLPPNYPLVAPTVKFRTRIFHPNVHFKNQRISKNIQFTILIRWCFVVTPNTTLAGIQSFPIAPTGEICLDLLKNAWTAVYTLQAVCRAIIQLLAHPEADSPLNCDCGNLLRSGDTRGYRSLARMYTRLYALFQQPTL